VRLSLDEVRAGKPNETELEKKFGKIASRAIFRLVAVKCPEGVAQKRSVVERTKRAKKFEIWAYFKSWRRILKVVNKPKDL